MDSTASRDEDENRDDSEGRTILNSAPVQNRRGQIALLIPTLKVGGSERQMVSFAVELHRASWHVLVLTLRSDGPLANELRLAGINHVSLGSYGRLRAIWIADRLLRERSIRLVQAYLITAQVFSLLLKLLRPGLKIIMGVRDTLPIYYHRTPKDVLCDFLVFRVPWLADFFVFNSIGALRSKRCSARSNTRVISNGIDTRRFIPLKGPKDRLDPAWPMDAFTVGVFANISDYKDFPNLLSAAAIACLTEARIYFAVIGDDRSPLGSQIKKEVQNLGLGKRFTFFGPRNDVPELLPKIDVLCSSSKTEGFSNVIAEAMSCGVACVVTNVGESANIVGDTGWIVPPRDPERLASALLEAARSSPSELLSRGQLARHRVMNLFNLDRLLIEYEKLYRSLLA